MLNLSILNIATKLYIKLRSGNSDTVAMHTRSFRMGVVTGLLLIAGLLPMLAAAQTPTSATLSVDPATVTESATATTITVTATLIGGTFDVARIVSFSASRGAFAGTATEDTDYTRVPATNLTIHANMASGSVDIMFTAHVDAIDEPAGETVFIGGFLTNSDMTLDPSVPIGASQRAILTINDPHPAFTNMAMFSTAIEAAENQTAAGTAGFFAATGGDITYTLGGADASRFTLSGSGTLTFDDAPDFEMPRGMALSGSNTNNYALTVTAMNSLGTAESGAITVTVTDENEAPPVLAAIPTPGFTEHTAGGFTITATDVDAGQMLTYTLTGETHGATLNPTTGGFSWTPGEADGGEERMFSVTVTDDGTPPMSASTTFSITATELANRAPTGASITAAATVINPATPTVTATASDPDSDILTYTWSSSASGDTFDPATGASVTWTPATVTVATMVTLTVTVTDGFGGSVTATQQVEVNPDTTPAFASDASIDNQTYTVGTAITSLTLPEATGGNGAITYSLADEAALPTGLSFDGTARPPTITGTPGALAASMMFTYTATDGDTNTAASDIATLTFTITVVADTAPAFASDASIDDQTYTQDTAIEPLTLPAATGGNGTLTYTLTPAIPGLRLDSSTGVLSGTPTTAATEMYTYTAADGDDNMAADDAATLTFSITVNPMVLGIDDLTDRTFNIYPNPVSGRLTVERKGIAGDEISIHDLTGKRIHVPVREQSPRKVVLDVSGLAGGMYLVKVSGSGSTVRRLIVEHRQERF